METQPPLQPGYVTTDLFESPSPAGTPSFAHGCQISTPNAPMGPPWSVSGNIPNITNLLGVDLGNEFSAEAYERRGDRRVQIDKLGDGSDHVGRLPAIKHMMMMMVMMMMMMIG